MRPGMGAARPRPESKYFNLHFYSIMNRLHKTVVFSFASLLAAGLFSAGAQAQILNGNFAAGVNPPGPGGTQTYGNGSTAISDWTVLTTTQISWDGDGAFSVPAPTPGAQYLDITGNNDTTNGSYSASGNTYYTSGGVYQTFATTAGDTYDVTYLLGTDSYYNSSSTPGIEAFVSGTVPAAYSSLNLADPTSESGLASSHPTSRGEWTDEGFDFVASGSSTTLTLIGYSAIPIPSNQYIGLADVSVANEGNLSRVPDSGPTVIALALGLAALAGAGKFRTRLAA